MAFMDLYYEAYGADNQNRSLPYQLLIPDREERDRLVEMLKEDGFRQVTGLNYIPQGLYVNLTLKRFGAPVKPCGSASLNGGTMSYKDFMEQVYTPYRTNGEARAVLEDNWAYSAADEICSCYRRLLDHQIHRPDDENGRRSIEEQMAEAMKTIAAMVEWEA